MAVYPIALLITSPLCGGKIEEFGRKNSVFVGIILMTIATLMFGLGGYCHNHISFFCVSFIARTF
jgi:MFS family permease